MADIIPITIPPKCDMLRHRRVEYRLCYEPDTRQWEWSFSIAVVTRFHGKEESYLEAMTAAKTHIDLATGC